MKKHPPKNRRKTPRLPEEDQLGVMGLFSLGQLKERPQQKLVSRLMSFADEQLPSRPKFPFLSWLLDLDFWDQTGMLREIHATGRHQEYHFEYNEPEFQGTVSGDLRIFENKGIQLTWSSEWAPPLGWQVSFFEKETREGLELHLNTLDLGEQRSCGAGFSVDELEFDPADTPFSFVVHPPHFEAQEER